VTGSDLLQRIADLLRKDIGPAIEADYPRTQAFMAAVVLGKLGRQLALAGEHAAAETEDIAALLADLRDLSPEAATPAGLRVAIDTLAQTRDNAGLCGLVEALYNARPALGDARFTALLDRTRRTLRRSIDRRMAVAG
jgi:hypothetical protein